MAAHRRQGNPEDIVELILQDHVILKQLIEIMKSEDASFREKQAAFKRFAPALVAHAKPEEQTWYMKMKSEDMKVEGLEGDIEHSLADQLCEELKRTSDRDEFMAKVKVLAELVEHHVEEEEEDMLPEFKRGTTLEERIDLGMQYLEAQQELDAQGDDDAPSERTLHP
ncbi:hemerythrin domain-containing protein [Bdellovibrio sp. HCB209]|uniref:hemerythrin domain-containing protein n=1 Tax=Bdellovibrio sp. HCB209 TaxID=3394354 RepID=UPI0039B46894